MVSLARDANGNYCYEDRLRWEGIEFRFKERCSLYNFSEFLAYKAFEQLKVGRRRERYERATRERSEEREHEAMLSNISTLNTNQGGLTQLRLDSFFTQST